MLENYKTVYKAGTGEIIEKKSRFIGMAAKAESEEEALAFIENVKKKYWDARHHCFAYVIGENCGIQRMSDDGEPAKTAGKPILDVLQGEKLHDTVIVVTRYFGGTLLGTGGLVRAYTQAAKEAVAASVIITRILGVKLLIDIDYTEHGKVQYILMQGGFNILHTEYTDKVTVEVMVPCGKKEVLAKELTEGTNGKAGLLFTEECYYAMASGEMILF